MMRTYFALVHKDAGSAFGASFPDLPGCFSAADDEVDIFAEAQAALSLYVGDLGELPAARSIVELATDKDVRRAITEGAFLIAVPLIVAAKKERVNVMLDPGLVAGVDSLAKASGVSRSEYIGQLIAAATKAQSGTVVMSHKKGMAAPAKLSRRKAASRRQQ